MNRVPYLKLVPTEPVLRVVRGRTVRELTAPTRRGAREVTSHIHVEHEARVLEAWWARQREDDDGPKAA